MDEERRVTLGEKINQACDYKYVADVFIGFQMKFFFWEWLLHCNFIVWKNPTSALCVLPSCGATITGVFTLRTSEASVTASSKQHHG